VGTLTPDYCQPAAGNVFASVGTGGPGGPGGSSNGNAGTPGNDGEAADCKFL
jgi:hypothetical protein